MWKCANVLYDVCRVQADDRRAMVGVQTCPLLPYCLFGAFHIRIICNQIHSVYLIMAEQIWPVDGAFGTKRLSTGTWSMHRPWLCVSCERNQNSWWWYDDGKSEFDCGQHVSTKWMMCTARCWKSLQISSPHMRTYQWTVGMFLNWKKNTAW